MSIVYFDTETGGLLPQHPTIQIGAIAVSPDWSEVESFECKILFDEAAADPQALKVNHYDPEVWKRDGVSERRALEDFAAFLNRHRSVDMVSKRTGNPYSVARLAGHNAATFDGPRLFDAFRRQEMFCPAHPQVLCVLQRAMWFAMETGTALKSLKVEDFARHFGVPVQDAHDALADCRMAIGVARAMADTKETADW